MLFLFLSLSLSPCQIDKLDPHGMSPLHLCVYKNHPDLCQFLLSTGADPKICNSQGLTPFDLASDPLLKILKDESLITGANQELQLLEAARNGDLPAVKVRI